MKDFESERNFTRSGYEFAKVINAVELAELAAENDKTCSALRWTEWTVFVICHCYVWVWV